MSIEPLLALLLADAVIWLHFAFILFVVSGGLLVFKWRKLAWFHIPCVLWGALIEFTGWICPLTWIELSLRQRAGAGGYRGGFIDHYLLSIIYPHDLTRGIQILLGLVVLAVNLGAYVTLWLRSRG